MALTNCTITASASVSKTAGELLGTTSMLLTITPNTGYVVSASNFTNNTAATIEIQSIALSDTGTPGGVGNTVLVTVNLNPSYTMTAADLALVVDIDGAATLKTFSVAGTYDVNVGSNITPTASVNTAYSNSANLGTQETLFTKTLTAGSLYHFANTPTCTLNVSDASSYSVSTGTLVYNSSGDLTAITFTINYTYPNNSVTGDKIIFNASAVLTPVTAPVVIHHAFIDTSKDLAANTHLMYYFIWGAAGATFDLNIYHTLNTLLYGTGDFTGATKVKSLTSQTIDSTGTAKIPILIPKQTADKTYVVTLTGDLTDELKTHFNSKIDTISQYADRTATFSLTQTGSTMTLPSAAASGSLVYRGKYNYSGVRVVTDRTDDGSDISIRPRSAKIDFSFDVQKSAGKSVIFVYKRPLASDFTKLSSDGWLINISNEDIIITNDATSTVTVTVTGYIQQYGTANNTPVLDVDNFMLGSSVGSAPLESGIGSDRETEYSISKAGYKNAEAACASPAFTSGIVDTVYATTATELAIWKFWATSDGGTSYDEYAPATDGLWYKFKKGAHGSSNDYFVAKVTDEQQIEKITKC